METLKIVYMSRVKKKWLSLVSSLSLNEWKTLTGREGGGGGGERASEL